ncbi:class I SAM-dependent DNA methyltransferase [Xanthomonas arboricola]|uniref:class I SAM-dependent DNA methyltransferase n=1 Tax=Xanthomonas arboricola TaxID=56448 RepID=UPI000F8C7133|nr:DNA methyltransferase [Xanthomonas arboricola]
MKAVEMEEALSELAVEPFDANEFPYQFLAAFGNNDVTLKRLRKSSGGGTNYSDLPDAVLQRNHIHLAVCGPGRVLDTLAQLKASPKSASNKVKLVLATDGEVVAAEYLGSGEPLSCRYEELAQNFRYFLPFAGITTIQEVKENPVDVRAAGRLQKLYVELLANNPEWGTEERRADMNHFMARLIFCFFAEDTDIFDGVGTFTRTVREMADADGSDTHEVLEALFGVMNLKMADRGSASIPDYAKPFPYVNGGLFSGSVDVPRFTRSARSYLMWVGDLDWKEINPDIFGSMIQAVADKAERGTLGMHYTSVPNILKVLNPLFLEDLRDQLEAAEDNRAKLINLRKRMAHIRVFDPACGSGNFLVIAYKEMRKIEAEINRRRGEESRASDLPINNFRGIELNEFPAEIARLALIIAEFQCDVLYRGKQQALATVLPLDSKNWITCGNSLEIDWLSVCPPTGNSVVLRGDDLFTTPLAQEGIDFENDGGETYICGNPPYVGGKKQTPSQKADMKNVLGRDEKYKNLDYVCAFMIKACDLLKHADKAALVTTNSVSQGTHVPTLWPMIYRRGTDIEFAYEAFKWENNAKNNAGVSCTIIGLTNRQIGAKRIYGAGASRQVRNINAYLIEGESLIVEGSSRARPPLSPMITGNAAYDGGHLFLTPEQARNLLAAYPDLARIVRRVYGTSELVDGTPRYCLWIDNQDLSLANSVPEVAERIRLALEYRRGGGEVAVTLVGRPHQFRYRNQCVKQQIVVPQVSSEKREYLPVGLLGSDAVVTHLAHVVYDGSLVDFSILASKLHLAWVLTICGKLETRIRYASNLGWNTFPVPVLTEQNKSDLSRCAEDILLAREAHFPATISDLYDPKSMPEDLRQAHEHNDEVLERIYIGRRFRNDTERLEKLFDLYTKLAATPSRPKKGERAK